MDKSPQIQSVVNQPTAGAPATGQPIRSRGGLTGSRILAVIAGLFAVLLVYSVYQLHKADIALEGIASQMGKQLALINQRLEDSDSRIAQLTAELQVSTERLGLTQGELDRTRQIAARIREESQKRVQDLTQQLGEKVGTEQLAELRKQTQGSLEQITGDVSTTRQDVATVNKEVAATKEEVSAMKLTLSQYGTEIARNHDELSYLRRKGERDYFEFNLAKGAFYQVSDLRLKLNGADNKKQRYNIEYIADDRRLKKDKVNINEPIQVYVGGLKTPFEIVVNQVQKDRVSGYVSAPKDRGSAPGSQVR
jgi:chromosome segregation ATPase